MKPPMQLLVPLALSRTRAPWAAFRSKSSSVVSPGQKVMVSWANPATPSLYLLIASPPYHDPGGIDLLA